MRRFMKHDVRMGSIFALAMGLFAGTVATDLGQQAFAQTAVEEQPAEPLVDDTALQPPAAVVSIAGIAKLESAIQYFSEVLGQSNKGMMALMLMHNFTESFDPALPIGLAVWVKEDSPVVMAIIPCADIAKYLSRFKAQIGEVEEIEEHPGTLAFAFANELIYVHQQGDWALLSKDIDLLQDAPANPQTLLNGNEKKHDLSVELNVQRVPESLRDSLSKLMKQGFEQANERQGGEADPLAEDSLKQMERFIRDTESLQIGWSVDPENQRTFIDSKWIAVADSELAKLNAETRVIPSKFASLIQEHASAYWHQASSLGPEAIAQSETSIRQAVKSVLDLFVSEDDEDDASMEKGKKLVEQIGDLTTETIKKGTIDFGSQVIADTDEFKFTGGMLLSDGSKLVEILKGTAELATEQGQSVKLLLDQDQHDGVTIHVIKIGISNDNVEGRKLFGNNVRLLVGTSDDAAYFAFGGDAKDRMVKLIDAGKQTDTETRPVGQMHVNLLPILKLVQSVKSSPVVLEMINAIARNSGADYVTVVTDLIKNGQKARITIGEGIFRSIGGAMANLQNEEDVE